MKPAVLLVQVALVAVGILVYDQVRGSEPVGHGLPEVSVVREEVPAPPAPPPVVLEGKGTGVLVEKMGQLDRRLADVERTVAQRTTAAAPPDTRPVSGSGEGPVVPEETYVDENGIERRFSDEDIRWFRAMKDEVDAIERRERYVEMFDRQLERLGVSLTDHQRDKVVDATIAFREKIRDAGRTRTTQTDEERRAAMEGLRQEYSNTVFSLVPNAEAEKIVESMGRYPGFGWRQRDAGGGGGRRPGAGPGGR